MKKISIFTDGACSGNPGPGGYAAIIKYKSVEKVISGGEAQTTNNRMEMMALIRALEALKEPCEIELFSDSKYVLDALTKGWAKGWQKKGWIKSDKKPALNSDLWEIMLTLTDIHNMKYHWVKGHDGHKENERCDALAVEESRKFL